MQYAHWALPLLTIKLKFWNPGSAHICIWIFEKEWGRKSFPEVSTFHFMVFSFWKCCLDKTRHDKYPEDRRKKRNLNTLLEIWKTYLRVPSCNFTSTVYRLLGGAQGLFFSPTKEIKKCTRNKLQSLGTSLEPACCFLGNCVWDKWMQALGQRGV